MENVNSVCYIDKVNKITKIEGADRIEQASVNGWNSIIQKHSLQVGDLVLCITTDAVIPEEFGKQHNILQYLRTGNRVRTIKLKGVVSDCIIIPIGKLNVLFLAEGQDLMEKLKIYKFEPPVKQITLVGGRRIIQKDNLNFNKYYKFPNIKNVPNIFTEEDDVVITRKIHGTNARYGIVKKMKLTLLDRIKKFFGNKWVEYEYVYGSRNALKGSDTNWFYSTDVWSAVATEYKIKEDLWNLVEFLDKEYLGSGIIFYGEIYGPGIQGEKYNYNKKKLHIAFFDIEINKQYVDITTFNMLTADGFDFPITEVLYQGKYSKEIVDSFVINQFIEGTKIPHEGVVVAHVSGDRTKIAKVINPDYLIFAEKHLVPDEH